MFWLVLILLPSSWLFLRSFSGECIQLIGECMLQWHSYIRGVLYFESVFWLLLREIIYRLKIVLSNVKENKKRSIYKLFIWIFFLYTSQSRAFTCSFNWKKNCGFFIEFILKKSNTSHELCYELKSWSHGIIQRFIIFFHRSVV